MKTLTLSLKKQVDMIQEKDMQAPREEMEQMFNRQYSQCKELQRYSLDVDYEEQAIAVPDDNGVYMGASDVDAVLTELKNEINRKEGVGQRWFERCMEARAENVKLKRALWLARAERAADRERIFYFADLETKLDIEGYSYDSKKKKGCKKLTARDWRFIWEKVESKCLKKAEEYK